MRKLIIGAAMFAVFAVFAVAAAAAPIVDPMQIPWMAKSFYDENPALTEKNGGLRLELERGNMPFEKIADVGVVNDVKSVLPFPLYSSASSSRVSGETIYSLEFMENDKCAEARVKAGEVLKQIITPGMSDAEKVRAMHDYLALNVVYDIKVRDAMNGSDDTVYPSQLSYGALVRGKAVCSGYSDAMLLMCQLEDIPCLFVMGRFAGDAHSWNMVFVDGGWKHVDVTADDPVPDDGSFRDDYLFLSDAEIAKDHKFDSEHFTLLAELLFPGKNSEAEFLDKMGVLRGDGSGYQLGRPLNRSQMAVVLTRLMDAEDEVLKNADAYAAECPFGDVQDYAVPYVGYLYSEGIVKGLSATRYQGASPVTLNQCLTLLLRRLGYRENADFTYENAHVFAAKLGFISAAKVKALGMRGFLRGDMVSVITAIYKTGRY